MKFTILSFCLIALNACGTVKELDTVQQWTTYEIALTAENSYRNAYTDVDVWFDFKNDNNITIRRPAYWDGEKTWKVRFVSPDDNSIWHWKSYASTADKGLDGISGNIQAIPYEGTNDLIKHGLLKMSLGKRSVVHHDGSPFLVVGDTPWAMPFRATTEQVKLYAMNRQKKGFNTALLMSIQSDINAEGPNARNTLQGFKRGFEDLQDRHINKINPSYFQHLDSVINILIDHEIVPVYQPVFHGYGWKGGGVLGNFIDPNEYVRYCKYLLARYGSKPAFWLVSADNGGKDPGVKESGEMLELWDSYQQPTGIHYSPCDDYVAKSVISNPSKHCEHHNETHQGDEWLDFQWAQTGHSSKHISGKVKRMYENLPIKANLNGEPTYEGMGNGKQGLGWWQGEEAWIQLMSGGTMGVIYGAAGLWQWKVSADEEGWPEWAEQQKSWKQAMNMEGSVYVGLVSKILKGLNTTDIEKRLDLTEDNRSLLAREGELYISYLNKGGSIRVKSVPKGFQYVWFNPKTGEKTDARKVTNGQEVFSYSQEEPTVLVITGLSKKSLE